MHHSTTSGYRVYRNSSLAKTKLDVNNLVGPLAKAMALRPVTFKSNTKYNIDDNPDTVHMGFIAEEVEAVEPALAVYGKDNEEDTKEVLQSVAYERFSALAIGAIQELKAEIDRLSARVDELENK